MKEILKPKSKALTEKDCYEELARKTGLSGLCGLF